MGSKSTAVIKKKENFEKEKIASRQSHQRYYSVNKVKASVQSMKVDKWSAHPLPSILC